jgi:hypothetical protein
MTDFVALHSGERADQRREEIAVVEGEIDRVLERSYRLHRQKHVRRWRSLGGRKRGRGPERVQSLRQGHETTASLQGCLAIKTDR